MRSISVREGLDGFAVAKLFAGEHLGTEEEWKKAMDDRRFEPSDTAATASRTRSTS